MARFIKGQSRTQATLFPEVLDDYISEDNPVRVVDAFVDHLDLEALGFHRVVAKDTGRPGYHPSLLLKLYLYGYLNKIQSSRRLEREAQRNVELMWLIERLAPDFKTIADFRKDNSKGIKNTCRSFIALCRQMNMFSDVVVAIDGSKFKAVNSKENNYTPQKIKFHIDRVEKHIARYLGQLDEADATDNIGDESIETIQQKITWMKQRLTELQSMKKVVDSHPDKQVSTTDPDARLLKTQGMTRMVCYNVQSAVDTKHHLIVAHEVMNTPDRGQLNTLATQAQEALEQKDITVIADKGYYSRQDIKDVLDSGATTLVPKVDTSASEKLGLFNRSLFKYQHDRDSYICPAGNELPFRCSTIEHGLKLHMYFDCGSCKSCDIRSKCTRAKTSPRKMRRWEHENVIEDMERRLAVTPDAMLIRKQTVEHPFGTIKSWMGATHFLTKRFKNVSTEMNLHVLAYNLKRVLSIMGQHDLMAALRS